MDAYNFIISNAFPSLKTGGFKVTSPPTPKYNCVAWATGDDSKFWWPDPQYISYWPSNIPREESLNAFIKLFEELGYLICKNDSLEQGIEKIAIYSDTSGKPTHAARQLENGRWTSKLGQNKDIEHKLEGLVGSKYGNVKIIMKKKLGKR